MNYYQRHIGDYVRDTSHLSLLEHGVYSRLMDLYYLREAPLPAKDIARLVGAKSKDERAALNQVLIEFFRQDNDCWVQARCDAEIIAAREAFALASQNGKNGAAIRWASKKNKVAMPPPSKPHKPGNGVVVAPNLHSDSEDQGSSAAALHVDPPGSDPRKAIFDLGKRILGASSGGLISAAITRKGESYVAGVIGEMSMQTYADPKAYFQAATRVGHDRVVV